MQAAGLSWSERLTLIALKHFASEGGQGVRPGVERLRTMTGLGRRTVIRSIQSMEASGVLRVTRKSGSRTSATVAPVSEWAITTSAREAPDQCHSGTGPEFHNGTTSAREAPDQCHSGTRSLRSLKSVCVNSSGSLDEEPTSPPTHTSISDLIRKDQETHAEVLGIRCPSKIPTGDDLKRCVQALAQFTDEERGWIHLGHQKQTQDKRRFRSYPNAYPRRRGVDRVELDTAWCMDRVELGRQIAEASAAEKKARGVELADQAERDATSEERCRVGRARAREAREQLAGRKKS